ncbi:MAG: hypothetical protein HY940_09045 [Gammaproteobacteria bacterium]|nr:hypothetical protein [Gammaproteobacteria bacterium]
MKIWSCATLLLSTLLVITPAQAADIKNGQRLQQQSCQRCHDDAIYTRRDSIIFSYKALRNRVSFCDSNSGTHWTPQQQDDVVEYLNSRFYKFKQ